MSKAIEEFDAWAPYYDFVHQGLAGEAEFYVDQALKRGGGVLELGCGTGRVALAMAMSGAEVVGLDISAGMLAICGAKQGRLGETKGRLRLIRGDMSAFALRRRFSFIAMPYRSFMHLLSVEAQLACFGCVYRHLKAGGVFTLNLWAASPSAIARRASGDSGPAFDRVGEYDVGEGIRLAHFHSATFDEYAQLIHEKHLMRELDASGKVLAEETLTLTRAWCTPREMHHLARLSGFDVVAVLGDFDGTVFGRTSTEMIWVLRRPA